MTLTTKGVSLPVFTGLTHLQTPGRSLNATAVVLRAPECLELRQLPLDQPGVADVVVDMEWSGISTGTERLLWSGRMPAFPGMGYPLVPGYEGVGRVSAVGEQAALRVGQRVFVPGARCFGEVRGLFGSAAARVVAPATRVLPVAEQLGERAILLALAATALHALEISQHPPQLIIGHGVLGRLLARLCVLRSATPVTVWETHPARRGGAQGYQVVDPGEDSRRDYHSICDVSGDSAALDKLIGRLAPRGEIVLAGFYAGALSFDFPAAFMREARLSIAAQWQPDDLLNVTRLCESGKLSLAGLITHGAAAADAVDAYRTAFTDPECLKMHLDWRHCP
ncbi:MAG TPA: chlorophyll synthesis pathway protein BchC [Steroidobacteraceae bacterium]